ncbi:serine/threonine-protein kinase [Diaminobutyricimonas sp. TR449]|uniref:serine/threonine-protein kinase n=1 Tax=Diaminobutyricimonas sp. TR449 TaxID=2708076 RepID=UPI001FB92FBE|nr:serine/threonine-protein kinase [Diaminobutyricimonas sp. TR449]
MTAQETEPEIGAHFADRYTVTDVIGRGGMASVYEADDEFLGRTVALKVFHTDVAEAADVQRQTDEIRLLAGLSHPCLVTVFDAVSEGDRIVLVMERVVGQDLRHRLAGGPRMDAEAVALLGADVADALAYVHGQNIIHRDVKPANILILDQWAATTGPRAKLADFGIAKIVDGSKLTSTGSVIGTANYLSPEQALGEPLSSATDVYSLGLVLLECLTGAQAFPGSGLESAAARVTRDPVVPDELGSGWMTLLTAMTTRQPALRPTAAEVAFMLRELAAAPLVDEELARTLAMPPVTAPTVQHPVATDQNTEPADTAPVNAEQSVSDPSTATPVAPARAGWRSGWPSGMVIAAAIALILVVAGIAINLGAPAADAGPDPVQYPAVEGNLGTHLEQLQRTVEP